MANYAPDGYYYTVAVYEAKGYENAPTAGDSLNGWLPISSGKKVNTTNKVLYRVSIYNGTGGLPGLIVRDDQGSRLSGSGDFASFKNDVKDIADISSIRTINDRYYDFTVTPKKDGTVLPKLVPQVEINGIWRDVKIQTGSKIPSVIFTKAPTTPQVPSTVNAYDAYGKNGPFEWNSCDDVFLRLWHSDVKEVPVQGKGGTTVQEYTVSIKFFDKNGDKKGADKVISKIVNKKPVNREKATEAHVPGSLTQLALRELDKAKNCKNISSTSGGRPADPNATTESVAINAQTFNPPPHVMTRHFSPIAWGGTDSYDDGNAYNQLGMIYQDTEILGTTEQKFWGFRFLFNPTFWNYTMSSTNSVDWTRNSGNNAVLVGDGIGGTMSLRLVIDRVADMNTMRRWVMGGRTATIGQPDYPYNLTAEQCEGLLRRGTEYDLEYIFRVMNGDPIKSSLLGAKVGALEVKTANTGWLTTLPFTLKLNDQQRYRVKLSSLTVQHDMFTHEMIPIRTLVDLGLERIPEFYTTNKNLLTIDTQTQAIPSKLGTKASGIETTGRGGGVFKRGLVID